MFTYLRKSILLYAKSSNVDFYTVYGKYSQRGASEFTLVLCSALISFFLCVSKCQYFWNLHWWASFFYLWVVGVFLCLFSFITYCKFSSELPVLRTDFFQQSLMASWGTQSYGDISLVTDWWKIMLFSGYYIWSLSWWYM